MSDSAIPNGLEKRPIIVVIGRNNVKKPAGTFNLLISELQTAGLDVIQFESRVTQTDRWLVERFERLTGPRFPEFAARHQTAARLATRLIKAGILLTRPTRWNQFLPSARRPARGHAPELRRLLHSLSTRRVYLVAQSFGAIVATLVDSEDAVRGIACFGYPFKHPLHDDQPYRTEHLAHVSKPLLIIQGDQDEYGDAATAQLYTLPSSAVVIGVSATHDYSELEPADYQKCVTAIFALIDETFSPAVQEGSEG